MTCEGLCLVDRTPGTGPDGAAAWIAACYPDISVRFEQDRVTLSSPRRDEGALRTIWVASLLNEELLSRGAARRAELLDELTR
jgi:hypothetical protein